VAARQSSLIVQAESLLAPFSLRQHGTYYFICISFLRSLSAKTKYKRR
jgi:hypothetical protein